MRHHTIEESPLSHFLFNDTHASWIWLIARLYVGYEWLVAGGAKATSSAWVGLGAGSALRGFLSGALAKTAGPHPDVQGWYAFFLQNVVLAHPVLWSNVIAYGE